MADVQARTPPPTNDVKNTECSVFITTRRGRTWAYRRDNDGWTQTGPTGKVHRMTAEQLLSHILPPLAAGRRSPVTVRVVRRTGRETRSPKLE